MKINLEDLKKAIKRIESDKGDLLINITTPLDRSVEIRYHTFDQEIVIVLYPSDSDRHAEINRKERL